MIGTTSIAVLYFENEGPDESFAYLCSGITDDLIIHLARNRTLRVVSRDDVLPFRARDVDVRDLGEALVVDYVLTGRVRAQNGSIHIEARLVEVGSNASLWQGQFDRSSEEVVDVVNEVLRGVARTLEVSPEDAKSSELSDAVSPRAYTAYLEGRDLLSRRGRKNVEAAVALFDDAVAVSPDFAMAHLAAAEGAVEMFTFYDDDEVWLDRALAASRRAGELDAGLVEALFVEGVVQYHRDHFDKARDVFEQVVRVNPSSYEAYRWLGIVSDVTGKYDDALDFYETAAQIKPYSVEPWLFMNMTHRRKGDVDAAMMSAKRFLEVGIRKLEINPDDEVTLSRFAAIYTLLGEGEKARDALQRILKWHPDDGTVLYNCACTYALLGDNDQALLCLRMALENGYRNVREWVKTDPDFADLRATEAFKQLLIKFDTPR